MLFRSSYETLARDNPYLNVATYVKALEKKAIEIEKEAERTSKAQALEKQIKGKQKELAEMREDFKARNHKEGDSKAGNPKERTS